MKDRYVIGQRLRFLRGYRKMSQDAVSLASGVDRSYISEIETGKCSPTVDVMRKIAKALNVQLLEIFTEGVSEPQKGYNGEPFSETP